MKFGVILKGLSGALFGPAFILLSNLVEYTTGSKSGKDIIISLALAGFLDSIVDLEEFGFEVDNKDLTNIRHSSLIVGKALLESGIETYIDNYNIQKRPDGLYVPNISILNCDRKNNIYVDSIWKNTNFDKNSINKVYLDSPKINLINNEWISSPPLTSNELPTEWI